MSRLYYLLWAVRILAGLFIEIWDVINHWRSTQLWSEGR